MSTLFIFGKQSLYYFKFNPMKLISGFPWVAAFALGRGTQAFSQGNTLRSSTVSRFLASQTTPLAAKKPPAGSFFNRIPDENDSESDNNLDAANNDFTSPLDIEREVNEILQARRDGSKAKQPSTINGKPTNEVTARGFGKQDKTGQIFNPPGKQKPFVGIGPALNDPTKPEYDDQGYTLYSDERTGEKSRVFEALVDYPCKFTLKIVGANEGLFVEEMVAVVAETCQVEISEIAHSTKTMGKWTSVTVHAPVESANMLYELYETVDRDPRVKFKF